MNIIESIITFIKGNNKAESKEKAPMGVCPPCWGYQEFDGMARSIINDHQIEVNAGREKYNFIQDFVTTHIDGITLKNTLKGQECPSCKKIVQ